MTRKKVRGKKPKMDIDLTPMIDVVFNLLIFFLCSPFKVPEGQLDAFLPKEEGTEKTKIDKPPEKMVIRLVFVKDGPPTVRIGLRPLPTVKGEPDFNVLARILARAVQMNPSPEPQPVEIDSDRGVRYMYVIGVLNACTMARVEDVRFSLPIVGDTTGDSG